MTEKRRAGSKQNSKYSWSYWVEYYSDTHIGADKRYSQPSLDCSSTNVTGSVMALVMASFVDAGNSWLDRIHKVDCISQDD